ncbi:MAG: PLD nuclease N-terminal domain-containing protein [Candidatus Woesearchaeota archaeon]
MIYTMNNMFGLTFIFIPVILLSLASLGIWLWALIDCLASKREDTEKILWILVIFLFNLIGAIVYLLIAKTSKNREGKISRKKEHNTKGLIMVLVVLGIILMLSAIAMVGGMMFFFSTGQSTGTSERETRVIEEYGDEQPLRVTDMIVKEIQEAPQYERYEGSDLTLEETEKVSKEFCSEGQDPPEGTTPGDCYHYRFSFDAEELPPNATGIEVKVLSVDNHVIDMEFSETFE